MRIAYLETIVGETLFWIPMERMISMDAETANRAKPVRRAIVWSMGGALGAMMAVSGIGCAGGGDTGASWTAFSAGKRVGSTSGDAGEQAGDAESAEIVAGGNAGGGDAWVDTVAFEIEAGGYAAAFIAAKDVLRDARFELDRVDARAGVMTTHAKLSAGFGTPWVPHTADGGSAFEALINAEQRSVAVFFEPADASPDGIGDAWDRPLGDLRRHAGAIRGHVSVRVERFRRPGRRVHTTSVRLVSQWRDPELEGRGMQPGFVSPVRRDAKLATRLAQAISVGAVE